MASEILLGIHKGERTVREDLLDIETQGWQALSSTKDAAREFYEPLLSEDAVMLFPGGIILEGKDEILASFDAQPWKTFEIKEPRIMPLGDAAAILTYRITAKRESSNEYRALVSSAYYQKDGTWYLSFHQQTP
jgi:ketosteroid isomerase-like protein